MALTAAQKQRAVGAVLGMAVGDALGAGYEFGPTLAEDVRVGMLGGGPFGWAPGEWTDDTSMAIPILQALADGSDLLHPATMDRVAAAWVDWTHEAKDVGVHTSAILARAPRPPTAAGLTGFAAQWLADGHRSGGNGTLMRTTPIVLGYLDDPAGLTRAATAYALLTHADPEGVEACVLWNHAQRHAILTGERDVHAGLAHLAPGRASLWEERIAAAERGSPADFVAINGWVVGAFQAAWSAIATTPVPQGAFAADHLAEALTRAVRGGGDTDTVAAIAGGLLGASWGVSAIPSSWRRLLQGWPGRTGQDLLRLAALAAEGGRADAQKWPIVRRLPEQTGEPLIVTHPHDDGVLIGDVFGLDALPEQVGAVVSLCRLGTEQSPAAGIAAADHVEVWLIDSADREQNPQLEFVLRDTARIVKEFRDQGKQVFLHCVHAHSRTPAAAAIYAAEFLERAPQAALDEICAALPQAHPNTLFSQVVRGWSRD